MGLDTTHDCWSGAYSAFGRWRQAIARAAGYKVLPVKYEDGMTMDTIMLDWGHLGTEARLMGEWDETPDDPLLVPFVHSDCEGAIYPEQAGPLADALEALLPIIEDLPDGGHIGRRGWYRGTTEKFIAGLREAAEAGEPVEFH